MENMKKRYQIFVSSTYKDLIEERLIVKKAILEMKHFPAGMEEFPALDKPQMEYIKEMIDESSYYILILGGYLGSIDKETNKSYTYMEYEYALKRNIPILAIIRKDESGIDCKEKGKRKQKYLSFVSEVENGRLCKYYKDKGELAGIIHFGMNKQIEEYPQLGWIKEEIKNNRFDDDLLLRGDIIEEFHIGKEIYNYYDQDIKFKVLSTVTQKTFLRYGGSSQGTFELIIGFPGHSCAYNLYNYVDKEFLDNYGALLDDVVMQVSFAKLGNIDETLLFFSYGNKGHYMKTKIFRISNIGIQQIGVISGQSFMYIDYDISVPIGSQGITIDYAYVNERIYELKQLHNS